jgi:hypothetical protein
VATPEHVSPARTWVTVSFGVAAVAALAGGVAFNAASNSASNDAQTIRSGFTASSCSGGSSSQCAALKSDYDAENRDHTLSIVLYAGAGALAAGALLSWVFWPKTSETHTAVAPFVGHDVAGASFITAF